MRLRTWFALLAIAAASLASRPASAFKTKYHKEITEAALPFLKPAVLAIIVSANESVDAPWNLDMAGTDKFHFNDCGFAPASANIEDLYKKIIETGQAANFGMLLHTVQDFYAHSNWVEQRLTDLVTDQSRFGTPEDGSFPVLEVMKPTGGVVLLGVDVGNYVLRPGSTSKQVTVEAPDKKTFLGIVTGTYDGDDSKKCTKGCPRALDVGHWDSLENERGLNKDSPSREGFWDAYQLAYRQTVREWCRLRQLAKKKSSIVTLDNWVQPGHEQEERKACITRTVPQIPTTDESIFNVKARVGGTGYATDAALSSGDWSAVGSIEARWKAIGVTGGVGYARAVSGGDWCLPWQGGLLVAWPSLFGGPVGAVKWVRAPGSSRAVLDLGWDFFLWRPTRPILFGGPIRISVIVGLEDPFGKQAFVAGMGLSWSVGNFDIPW